MNERIRELIKEADRNCSETRGVYDEILAELIIQDCVRQIAMIGVSNFENDDISWTVDKSIENIRKHFGVEL